MTALGVFSYLRGMSTGRKWRRESTPVYPRHGVCSKGRPDTSVGFFCSQAVGAEICVEGVWGRHMLTRSGEQWVRRLGKRIMTALGFFGDVREMAAARKW